MEIAQCSEQVARKRIKRHALQASIDSLFGAIYGESFSRPSLRTYAQTWLAIKKPETSQRTQLIYSNSIGKLLSFLGPAADDDIAELDRKRLIEFREAVSSKVRPETCNMYLRAVRGMLRGARRDGFISVDPSEFIEPVKLSRLDRPRRPFTVSEIKQILEAADPEWQSMIKFGLYTGQRIGDLARLTRGSLDLEKDTISLRVLKTDKWVVIPICAPLKAHVLSMPPSDDPSAPLHPESYRLAVGGRADKISYRFARILDRAGLRKEAAASHNGVTGRRTQYQLSFHSLRHTFISMLKHAGAPQAAVLELAGHSSAAMSQQYTHSGLPKLARATALLPKV